MHPITIIYLEQSRFKDDFDVELYEKLEQRTKAERRKNPDQSIKRPQPPWDSIYRGHQRAMVDEFGELNVFCLLYTSPSPRDS